MSDPTTLPVQPPRTLLERIAPVYWWTTRGIGLVIVGIVVAVFSPIWVPIWCFQKLEDAAQSWERNR